MSFHKRNAHTRCLSFSVNVESIGISSNRADQMQVYTSSQRTLGPTAHTSLAKQERRLMRLNLRQFSIMLRRTLKNYFKMKMKPSASVYLFGLWVLFEYSTRYTALRVYRLVVCLFVCWCFLGSKIEPLSASYRHRKVKLHRHLE